MRTHRNKFNDQRGQARARGIAFNLTWEEWINWWGDDVDKRGNEADSLCMCRYNDTGPYELGNIYKDTRSNNSSFGMKGRVRTPEHRAALSKAQKGKPAPNKGVPHTEETKRKIGAANAMKLRKPIMTPDGRFNSLKEAAASYKIDTATLIYRLRKWDGYEYIDKSSN